MGNNFVVIGEMQTTFTQKGHMKSPFLQFKLSDLKK